MKKKKLKVTSEPKMTLKVNHIKVIKHYKFTDEKLENVSYTIHRAETSHGSKDNWNLSISKKDMDALRACLNNYAENEPNHPDEHRD